MTIWKCQGRKINFYENLKDPHGNIHPRWNTTCRDEDGISGIRKRLLEMLGGCCSYCGDKLEIREMEEKPRDKSPG